MVRQIGSGRRADGTEVTRLVLLEGDAATSPPEGARTVAFTEGVDAAQRAELVELRREVVAEATRTGLQLNEAGRAAAAAGRIDFPPTVLAAGDDATELEQAGWISVLVRDGWIDLEPATAELFRRYAELDERQARFTAGLFELPIEAPDGP